MQQYQKDFIAKLTPYAKEDWENTRVVLPSVTLAQGLRESAWGTSELAIKANNLLTLWE